jgi:hypothetical protein
VMEGMAQKQIVLMPIVGCLELVIPDRKGSLLARHIPRSWLVSAKSKHRPSSPCLAHLQPLARPRSSRPVVPDLVLDRLRHGAQVHGQVGRIGHQVACARPGRLNW